MDNMHKARALTHVRALNSGSAALPAHQRYVQEVQQKKNLIKLYNLQYPSFLEQKDAIVWSRQ